MENIRIYEEDGYIHFIMRPEDLMRLRYSTEAKTPFADFMDRWLTQMKTQVRENTMDGYRYAFEKHIKPFFTARGTTLATARPMDFQDFVNLKFDQGLSPTSIVKFHSIMHKCLKYAVALQIIPTNPSDNVMLPKRTRFRGQVYDRTQINIFWQRRCSRQQRRRLCWRQRMVCAAASAPVCAGVPWIFGHGAWSSIIRRCCPPGA